MDYQSAKPFLLLLIICCMGSKCEDMNITPVPVQNSNELATEDIHVYVHLSQTKEYNVDAPLHSYVDVFRMPGSATKESVYIADEDMFTLNDKPLEREIISRSFYEIPNYTGFHFNPPAVTPGSVYTMLYQRANGLPGWEVSLSIPEPMVFMRSSSYEMDIEDTLSFSWTPSPLTENLDIRVEIRDCHWTRDQKGSLIPMRLAETSGPEKILRYIFEGRPYTGSGLHAQGIPNTGQFSHVLSRPSLNDDEFVAHLQALSFEEEPSELYCWATVDVWQKVIASPTDYPNVKLAYSEHDETRFFIRVDSLL